MRVFAVDDEQLLLNRLVKTIAKCLPEAEVLAFTSSDEVIAALEGEPVDIAFLDIELGDISGTELAGKIKAVYPFCNIIFCTGFRTHAIEAFDLGACDYLIKPINEEKLRHSLSQLRYIPEIEVPEGKLYVRCFGEFEVFYDGMPLKSLTKKAKELFAFLIDKAGALCSTSDITDALFFDKAESYYRVVKVDLEKALGEIGASDVLIKEWNKLGVDRSKVLCDYYEYLSGNPAYINLYKGDYMNRYDWAKGTLKNIKNHAHTAL